MWTTASRHVVLTAFLGNVLDRINAGPVGQFTPEASASGWSATVAPGGRDQPGDVTLSFLRDLERVVNVDFPRYLTVLSSFACPSSSWTARRFLVLR